MSDLRNNLQRSEAVPQTDNGPRNAGTTQQSQPRRDHATRPTPPGPAPDEARVQEEGMSGPFSENFALSTR